MTCVNAADPLALSIQNNPLTSSGNAVTRGIALNVGTPAEQFSMRPAFNQNNTFLSQSSICQNAATNYSCIASHGGLWNPDTSTTDKFTTNVDSWNGTKGTDATPTGSETLVWFNDDWSFSNRKLPQVPFYSYTFRSGDGAVAGLALGYNSSFLQQAVSGGVIPSKRYGLWVGSEADTLADGQLILGGYDQARLASDPQTYASSTTFPFRISVQDIQWQATTGNTTSLLYAGARSFNVSLEPYINYLQLPQQVWRNFQSLTGGTYSDSLGVLTYPNFAAPKGNLIVTLTNGFRTTIPASELFGYLTSYDSSGKRTLNNTFTTARVSFNYAEQQGTVPFWGLPFLTMNYIMTDFDNGNFQMASAVRDNFGTNTVRNMQRFCAVPQNNTNTTTTSGGSSGSNTGAIVGGVVGGIGGLLLILGLVWFLRRRKRRGTQAGHGGGLEKANVPLMPQSPHSAPPGPASQGPPFEGHHNAGYGQNNWHPGPGTTGGAALGAAVGGAAIGGAAAAGYHHASKQEEQPSELASPRSDRASQYLPQYSQPDSHGYQESSAFVPPLSEMAAKEPAVTYQQAPVEMAATSGPFEMSAEHYRD